MRKIPTIFLRDFNGNPKHVTTEQNPDCAWVFAGEGVATRKFDGTCVMYDGERWWARREVKMHRTPPPGWVPLAYDGETGKTVGWEPAEQSSFWKYLHEAVEGQRHLGADWWRDGTYELIGPKINGNPETLDRHELTPHATAEILDTPRDFDGLAEWLHAHPYEGIVWHHPDGRMAKIKARDFPRPAGQPLT